ncbi:MAG TPA: trypsin-like peptidase domain-containing protein [Chloroflexia bacterium]|nr:trypsin-like peptidase domain-containing protein [Chloroflexia bacterium]
MANFAIVIGIDNYAPPQQPLKAAVGDAIRFAQWALQYGGVPAVNLRLLLSPAPGKLPPQQPAELTGLPVWPPPEATYRAVEIVIQEFEGNVARGADRLFFYYSGHGVSLPGVKAGGLQGPAIVPTDLQDKELDRNLLIPLQEAFNRFAAHPPAEQFFFVDACRDFALEGVLQPAAATGTPFKLGEGANKQCILYAALPGEESLELGRGMLARGLIEGLEGAPGALDLDQAAARGQYVVTFSSLASYTGTRVADLIRNLPKEQHPWPVQTGGVDPVLLTLNRADLPPLTLRVYVEPSEGRAACRRVGVYQPQHGTEVRVAGGANPPVDYPALISPLEPGYYSVRAEADAYQVDPPLIPLVKNTTLSLQLVRVNSILESIPQPQSGLEVTSPDRRAYILVWDAATGEKQGGGTQQVILPTLPPGVYRVQLMLAGAIIAEETVAVQAGQRTYVSLKVSDPSLGEAQKEDLMHLGMAPADGYVEPSEWLGSIADAKLASLLGFAAFAANWSASGFEKLKGFGIRPITDIPEGQSGLLVLIGASGMHAGPGVTSKRFLNEAQLIVRDRTGSVVGRGGFEILSGFSHAAQHRIGLSTGSFDVQLDFPGLARTHYALVGLPDRVSVLVVVADDTGAFDVQQYLLPLPGHSPYTLNRDLLTNTADAIRTIELAQRCYSGGHQIPESEIGPLLNGKWLNPLLGALGGYSLLRSGNRERFNSAMQNMLTFFPQLPDTHVLAGLYEPALQSIHFANAVEQGLPIFAEGFRALHDWYASQPGDLPDILQDAGRGLLPTSPWTAWVVERPTLLIKNGHFANPPANWADLEQHRNEIEYTCLSVGRIKITGSESPLDWIGSGFLVAQDVVMIADFEARMLCEEGPGGRWRFKPGVTAHIDFDEELDSSNRLRVQMTSVLEVQPFAGFALFNIAPNPNLPDPLVISSQEPDPLPGRRVYVVGYPAFDARTDAAVLHHVFGGVYNVKRLMPGAIISVCEQESRFDHDCFTTGGTAGGCVVDLQTNRVIGLHYSGRYDAKKGYKHNEAVALWKFAGDPILMGAGIVFG